MSYPEEILSTATLELAQQRKIHQQNADQIRARAYTLDPRIAEIDQILRSTMSKIMGCSLRPDPKVRLEDVQAENQVLQEERRSRLQALDLDASHLEGIYRCKHCSDSGWVGKTMCSCLRELCSREQLELLSPLLRNNPQGFTNFSLEHYSKTPPEGCSTTPYETMSEVLRNAMAYVEKYPRAKIKNLLFIGGTGLGKTFLSGCIAREIALKGGSVTYSSAIGLFEQFDNKQFRKKEPSVYEEAVKRCRDYLTSDLLILDDLGTENPSAYFDSYFYDLINSRLLEDRHTVISTNFTLDELAGRYTPQVMSRLKGEYVELEFIGGDLREDKKRQRGGR